MKSKHYFMELFKGSFKGISLILCLLLISSIFHQANSAVVNVYPQSLPRWTGSVKNNGSISTSSVVYSKGGNSGDRDRGWMKFDLSEIPIGATINNVKLKYFITSLYNPTLQFRRVTGDPVTLLGTTLWSQIGTGTIYYTGTQSSPGWYTRTLVAQARTDIQNALSTGWIAIGMYCTETSSYFFANADGWNQTNKPYLEIDYTTNFTNDIALNAITSPVNFACEGTYPISISILNAGINTLTSAVVSWSVNSIWQQDITWTGSLVPGANTEFTLDTRNFPYGNYIISATLSSPNGQTDPFTGNNTKTVGLQIKPKPSIYIQPVDTAIGVGGDASFKTVGAGAGITYLWQVSTNGGLTFNNVPDLSPYSNVTSSEMNITGATQNMNGYLYRCFIAGDCEPPAISDTVILSVGPPVTVIAGKGYACNGQQATVPIIIKNAINTQGMKLKLFYNSAHITYVTTSYINPLLNGSLVVTSVTDSVKLNWAGVSPITLSNDTICKLVFSFSSNNTLAFDTVTSEKSKITGVGGAIYPSHYTNGYVNDASPGIVAHPEDKLAVTGTTVFFRVLVTGTPFYQWQVSTNNGGSWANLSNNVTYSGVTDDTLYVNDPTLSMSGYKYQCVLNSCGNSVTSNPATMTVMKLVRTWFDTIYDCTCFTPSRDILMPIYVNNFDSITSASLSFFFKNSSLQYNGYQYLNPALQLPLINPVPGPTFTMVRIASFAMFGSMAIPDGQALAILKFKVLCDTARLQWETWNTGACQYSTGTGSNMYVFDAWWGDGFVLDGGPTIATNPVNDTVYAGEVAFFSCTGSTIGDTLTYQWQFSTNNGSTWSDCANGASYFGVTTPNLTVYATSISMNGYMYRCILYGLCDDQITNTATLKVNSPPIYLTIPEIISCQGDTIVVPVNVQNFTSVCSFSLKLGFNNALMSYAGYSELNAAIPSGFSVTTSGGNATLSWTSATPATIAGTGTLVKLKFTTNQLFANSALSWVNTPIGTSYFRNCSAGNINTIFTGSTVSVNPIPLIYNVITPFPASGHFCLGSAGAQVGLDVTQNGVNYALYRDGVLVPGYGGVAGTGYAIAFNIFNIPGTYTVRAYYPATGCSVWMDQFVIISADSPPVPYNVTGSGSYCTGGSGLPVGLSNSESGKEYFLYRDGFIIDTVTVIGSGGALDFGNQSLAGTYTVTARNAFYETCPTTMTGSAVITINPFPAAAGTITGPSTNPCQGGSNYTYCVPTIENASSYLWTLPPGCNPVSGTSSSCITVNFSPTATSGTITVKGSNGCGEGAPSSLNITLSLLPGTAGTISGPDSVCPGTSYQYTIGSIQNATSYNWTFPGGFSITSGSGTSTVTVNVGTLAASGNISVTGHNTCGDGSTATKPVVVKALPAAAGTISGPATPCQGKTETYSVAPIANVPTNGYHWSLPLNASGNSTTNIINVTFATNAQDGNISVYGQNSCGAGTASTKTLDIQNLPSAAGVFTAGPNHVCKGSSYTYTIAPVTGATSYTWTAPAGFTTGNMVTTQPTITFSIGVSALNGNITVAGTNGCGNGTISSIGVTVHNLPSPTLSSLGTICRDGGPVTLSGGNPTGGSYSGTGVSGGILDPTISGTGTFTITYTYTDQYGCVGTAQNTITVVEYPSIEGRVTYDNTNLSPMGNVKVYLKNAANTAILDSTLSTNTVPYGNYAFRCLSPSTNYNLACKTTRTYITSEVNAQDALKMLRVNVGLETLSQFRMKVADVNSSNSINSLDALLTVRRWAQFINIFPNNTPDWMFSTMITNPVIVQSSDITCDILALCTGDVNGSATPDPLVKTEPSVILETSGYKEVYGSKSVDIPVVVKTPLTTGSVSLILTYPEDEIEIEGIYSSLPGFISNILDNQLRFGWYDLNPVRFNAQDVLLTLKVKVKHGQIHEEAITFFVDPSSVITDGEANTIEKVVIAVPGIKVVDNVSITNGKEYFLGDNKPNPFNSFTEITYYLPEDGMVKLSVVNLLGEEVKVLVNNFQPEGQYTEKFDGSSYTPGMYMYKIDIKGKTRHFVQSHTMVITD